MRDTTGKQVKMRVIPPLRCYLEKVLRDMGGILHWADKSEPQGELTREMIGAGGKTYP